MKDVNPRIDIAFKKIFGTEENKDLLISLINSIVGKEDQVTSITLMNPYNQKDFQNDKMSILDIKAVGHKGKKFNIEVQISDEKNYDKRALYYWAKLYTEQLKESQNYSGLRKVIGIHILNFTSIPKAKKYHNKFYITEEETGLMYFSDLEVHTIELKKFTSGLNKEFEELGFKIQNYLDMWSAFLTRHDLLDTDKIPKYLNNAPIKKALKVLNVMNFSEEERNAYEEHLKWFRMESSSLEKAEEKAEKRGHKNGLEEGRKEGHKEGEKKKSIEIARLMLKKGLASEDIAEMTGLTEAEIKAIQIT